MSTRVPSVLASTPITFAFFNCLLPVALCAAPSKVCNIAAAVASLHAGAHARSEPLWRRLRSYRAEWPPRTERGAPRPAPRPMQARRDASRVPLLPRNVFFRPENVVFPRSLLSPRRLLFFRSSSLRCRPPRAPGGEWRLRRKSREVESWQTESLPQPQPQRCTRGDPTEGPLLSAPRQGPS